MTPLELQIFADMMKQYSEVLGNNGCNDFVCQDTPAGRVLHANVVAWHRHPRRAGLDYDATFPHLTDFMVLDYLAAKINTAIIPDED
jgi:hypothetical protein